MRELGLLGFGEELLLLLALLLSPPPVLMLLLFFVPPFLRRRLRPELLLLVSMLGMPAIHEYGVTLSNTCNNRFLRATGPVWKMRHLQVPQNVREATEPSKWTSVVALDTSAPVLFFRPFSTGSV